MRARIFAGTILFLFLTLVLGLFYTQVLKHASYRQLSERNRIRAIPLVAPRGKIYDRSGRLLVSSRIAFDIQVIYQEIKDKKKVIDTLSNILEVDRVSLSRKMKEARKSPFIPIKIVADVDKGKAIRVEEARLGLAGVIVTTRPLRNYLYGNTISHVTGYLGRISESEFTKYKSYGYRVRDFVGKDGVEKSYNDYLRGTDGGLQLEVDSKGRTQRTIAIKEPRSGKNIYLSIDLELQKFCDSLLGEKKGAILAMKPDTGEMLAFVSHADFDPNAFVASYNTKSVSAILSDTKGLPLFDRAISGTYPSGSVFKIVIAAAALDSGDFSEKETFFCGGSLTLGNRVFHCWNEDGHGSQAIAQAIKNSCNVFFYQLGLLVGPDEIARYAFRFGFGRPTGIDLPGELSGFVPTTSWKKRKLKESWFRGETANYSIGQGYLLVTPIQILRLIGAVANGGRLVTPFVVGRIEDIAVRHEKSRDTGLESGVLEAIRSALKSAINAPHSTGLYARSKEIIISGKTGTAENPHGESHAWFTGFAPFEDPGISVVVFIEHGGKGGLDPARFAKQVIEEAKKLELL
ncbi:MAG: penicillin-binding protein 2 [Omnitrophica bacterium]|nr:penicillin-binding protein 2 [Candidatus Omnitrophota bacterium]